ncbi:MAG: IS110 family transposase [Patescibacteria group bacterium]
MATSLFKKNFPATVKLQEAADTADSIIGLDLHSKTTAICVINPKKPHEVLFQRKRMKNEELLAKIQEFPGKKLIACEAAYGWFPLRDALALLPDVTFVALDARKTSSWTAASGVKTDKVDAEVLCHVCMQGGIPRLAVHQPSRHARECFKLALHCEQLVRQRTRLKNQIRAVEREYGVNPYTGEIPQRSDLVTLMEADLLEALSYTEERIKRAEEWMVSLGKDDPILPLLRTIPGIGPINSFALRWKIEIIERFEDSAHLASYFGLGIRECQSGGMRRKGKITKTGSALVRKLLVQGAQAMCAKRPENLSIYFPSLSGKGDARDRKHVNKLVVAFARKNLTFIYRCWKHGEAFNLATYQQKRAQAAAIANARVVRDCPAITAPPPCMSLRVVPETAADLEFEFAQQGRDKV